MFVKRSMHKTGEKDYHYWKHHELIMEAKEYNKTQDEEIPWDGKSKILGAAEGECSIHYHCYRC